MHVCQPLEQLPKAAPQRGRVVVADARQIGATRRRAPCVRGDMRLLPDELAQRCCTGAKSAADPPVRTRTHSPGQYSVWMYNTSRVAATRLGLSAAAGRTEGALPPPAPAGRALRPAADSASLALAWRLPAPGPTLPAPPARRAICSRASKFAMGAASAALCAAAHASTPRRAPSLPNADVAALASPPVLVPNVLVPSRVAAALMPKAAASLSKASSAESECNEKSSAAPAAAASNATGRGAMAGGASSLARASSSRSVGASPSGSMNAW